MRLPGTFIGLFFILFFFLFILPLPTYAATKAGINIATHYEKFDQAVSTIGRGGWVYVMAGPADKEQLNLMAKKAENAGVHFVIRGQCGGDSGSEVAAEAWAQVLGGLETTNKIYFMPWNEPNGPAETDKISADRLNGYITAIINAFDTYGLWDKNSKTAKKVILLSPVLNQFNPDFEEYTGQLKAANSNFFSQFAGISMNLYAMYKDDNVNPGLADPENYKINSIGYPGVLQLYGVSGDTDVYGVESGVVIPSRSGHPVRYADALPQLTHLFKTWVRQGNPASPHGHWNSEGNFKMFTIFSYSPDPTSVDYNRFWLFENRAQPVIDAMKGVGGGSGPVQASSVETVTDFDVSTYTAAVAASSVNVASQTSCGGASSGALKSVTIATADNVPYVIHARDIPADGETTIEISYQEGEHPDQAYIVNKNSLGNARVLYPIGAEVSKDNLTPQPTPYQTTIVRACNIKDPKYKVPRNHRVSKNCTINGGACNESENRACGGNGYQKWQRGGGCNPDASCDWDAWGPVEECIRPANLTDDDIRQLKLRIKIVSQKPSIPSVTPIEGLVHQPTGTVLYDQLNYAEQLRSIVKPGEALDLSHQILYDQPTPNPADIEQARKPSDECSDSEIQAYWSVPVPRYGQEKLTSPNWLATVIDNIKQFLNRFHPTVSVDIYVMMKSFAPGKTESRNVNTQANAGFLPISMPTVVDHAKTKAQYKVMVNGKEAVFEPVDSAASANAASVASFDILDAEPEQNMSIQSEKQTYMMDPHDNTTLTNIGKKLCSFLPIHTEGFSCNCDNDNVPICFKTGITITPEPLPSGSVPGLPTGSHALKQVVQEASRTFNVPESLILAIMNTEGKYLFSKEDEYIIQYSVPGAKDPETSWLAPIRNPPGCRVASCGDSGPMQFTLGESYRYQGPDSNLRCLSPVLYDSWSYVIPGLQQYLNRTPDVCNIRDAVLGAALKLSDRRKNVCGNGSWSDENTVRCVASGYSGSCSALFTISIDIPGMDREPARQMPYCDYIWYVVQNFRGWPY